MNERPGRLARFVASVLAIVALITVVPFGLIAAARHRFNAANPLAGISWPWQWRMGDIAEAVRNPLTDDAVTDLLIRAALLVLWISVAIVVATTAIEVIHLVRHRGMTMPDVRGLGWAQPVARTLAAGLLVLVPLTAPKASLAAGGTPAYAAHRTEAAADQPLPSADLPDPGNVHSTPPRSHVRQAPTLHIVRRGESIYGIAEDLADAVPMTATEIADRILDTNLGNEMSGGARFTNPAYIEVGWELLIPADVLPATRPASAPKPPVDSTTSSPRDAGLDTVGVRHLVVPGDTLSAIAEQHLGDADAWPSIFATNAGRDMGDGRIFDDPHLIVPGWTIDIPSTDEPATVVDAGGPAVFADHPDAHITADAGSIATPSSAAEPGAGDAVPDAPVAAPVTSTATPPATEPAQPAPAGRDAAATTTTSTAPPLPAGRPAAAGSTRATPTGAPAPIRIEHAALLAAGVLALVGVRRRQRLRGASPRTRVPEPPPAAMATERRLRTVDQGERSTRVDVAVRAAAHELVDTTAQIGIVVLSADGDVDLRLTAPADLAAPWSPADTDRRSWHLSASVPVELLAEGARRVGQPCIALVQLGVADGCDVLVDLEACGTLVVAAEPAQADDVITAITAGLATSPYAEVAHLITVSLPDAAALGHRNAHRSETLEEAFELANGLVGSSRPDDRSTFSLRSLRTGGEMWEPAIILMTGSGRPAPAELPALPGAGRGIGLVINADATHVSDRAAVLAAGTACWTLTAFGQSLDLVPAGVNTADLADVAALIADAAAPLLADDLVWADAPSGTPSSEIGADPADDGDAAPGQATLPDGADVFVPRHHDVVVRLMGGVDVTSSDGRTGSFERSKTVELIAWLATHREASTRTAARTAMWELDVRDATFANVVSEARRGLGRLVDPPDDGEWVGRTLTEQLPLHDGVVTDAQLMAERLAAARLQPPSQAVETLRPAAELIRDMPFAGTSYLWPDAEGITSNLVLLATGVATELAGHALALGDTDLVFWATGQGLKVLAGHEELIALRMRAHARAGDLAGVRQEWESYERVIVADAWSDGEPAPKLLALRRELLTTPT